MSNYERYAINLLILFSIGFLSWGAVQFIKEILDILL